MSKGVFAAAGPASIPSPAARGDNLEETDHGDEDALRSGEVDVRACARMLRAPAGMGGSFGRRHPGGSLL